MGRRYSYSATSTWWDCPYLYKLKYIDRLEPKPDLSPKNALFLGTSVHEAIEKRSIEEGLNSYKSNYPELTKEHEIELFKLEHIMKKAIDQIPEGEYEYKLLNDQFVGYIDMLVKVDEGIYDLYDFKYSNNVSGYKNSPQIHIYKYFYEYLTGNKIRNMYYVFVPKYDVKLPEDATEDELKESIIDFVNKHDVRFEQIEYDKKQVSFFFARINLIEKAKHFEKRYSFKCKYCDFAKYCKTNGKDRSELVEKEIKSKENSVEEVNLWS